MSSHKMTSNIRIPMESNLKKAAQRLAKERGISLSAFMRSLVQEFVSSKTTRSEVVRMIKAGEI